MFSCYVTSVSRHNTCVSHRIIANRHILFVYSKIYWDEYLWKNKHLFFIYILLCMSGLNDKNILEFKKTSYIHCVVKISDLILSKPMHHSNSCFILGIILRLFISSWTKFLFHFNCLSIAVVRCALFNSSAKAINFIAVEILKIRENHNNFATMIFL